MLKLVHFANGDSKSKAASQAYGTLTVTCLFVEKLPVLTETDSPRIRSALAQQTLSLENAGAFNLLGAGRIT